MFIVLRTATADENLSKGAPVARPSTGKRGQLCWTPPASGTADLIKHRAAGLFSPQIVMSRGTPPQMKTCRGARPSTGKRFLAVPHASGVRHSQKSMIKHRAAGLFSYQGS